MEQLVCISGFVEGNEIDRRAVGWIGIFKGKNEKDFVEVCFELPLFDELEMSFLLSVFRFF